MKIFICRNSDETIRRESSSGGIFSLLASAIINKGGIVYGVAFDDEWNVVHRRVDNVSDLRLLCCSKYAYSHMGKAISLALNDLDNGRPVLFSGSPCQVAAMRKVAGTNPLLLLVEIVCHSAPEQKFWPIYLNELCAKLHKKPEAIQSINFRDKCTGWKNYSFTIKYSDGLIFSQPHGKNLWMQSFLKGYTVRKACERCTFKYPDGSRADITIGDFWGISQLAPSIDDDKGYTLMIARTEHGLKFSDDIGISSEADVSFEQVRQYNPALTNATILPGSRESFLEDINSGKSLLQTMNKFTRRPLKKKISSRVVRFKNKVLACIQKFFR